ncbi:MAG: lipase family protein [Pseudomonadota bacterium]
MTNNPFIDEIRTNDAVRLQKMRPPTGRAAYSDRMAWQMAVLSQLAYIKFEEQSIEAIGSLAEDLAASNNVNDIQSELVRLLERYRQAFLMRPRPERSLSNEENFTSRMLLRQILAVCGFKLQGIFPDPEFDPEAEIEGFVATCDGPHEAYAVLIFRGTDSFQDWLSNVDAGLQPLEEQEHPGAVSAPHGPKIHGGFHQAYRHTKDQIARELQKVGDRQLFIGGHSLGGALAVIATHFEEKTCLDNGHERVAACYTFGAPRVGNHTFNEQFHTPIYRIVNSFDPVPMLPPSGGGIAFAKFILRAGGGILPAAGLFHLAAEQVMKKFQGYRHPGDLRYMTAGKDTGGGVFPHVRFFKTFDVWDRIQRVGSIIKRRAFRRPDKFHNMSLYRRKLRYRAIKRDNERRC